MKVEVVKPGLLSLVQDRGRPGFQQYGVVKGGAMDQNALSIANWLVGNEGDAAVLELTAMGPILKFHEDAIIAVCGGNLTPVVDTVLIPMWRPVRISKGSTLRFGAAQSGYRAYLAVAGGWQVPIVMGSRSTDLRAALGGLEGRALRSGDLLAIGEAGELSLALLSKLAVKNGEPHGLASVPWSVSAYSLVSYLHQPFIHAVRGGEYGWFTEQSLERFFSADFIIDSKSDRMGYRLHGEKLKLSGQREMLSEAVCFGTVQVPSSGDPILLMADSPTTGGYPRIAAVIHVDLPVLAQMKPGEAIRFREISFEQARLRYKRREKALSHLKIAIRLKILGEGER